MRARKILAVALVLLCVGCTATSTGPVGSTQASPASLPRMSSDLSPAGGRPATLTPWPTYHGDRQRTGEAAAAAAPSGTLTSVTLGLDGAVYASPIVAGQRVIVATENDSVYALDATGRLRWRVSLGTPTPKSALPCGDIDPLGITGTPFYDQAGDTVFVVASIGRSAEHQLVALNAADGSLRWRRSLDLPGVAQTAMQQRGALTFAGGMVWVPFGGLAGDCGSYRGRVVGVPAAGGAPVAFTVPTSREGGIWTPPGPTVVDGDLLVAVGNGEATGGRYDHSDSVLRLRGTKVVDSFSPATWASDNASDLDLGSQGPALVTGSWVFQAGKSGAAFVLAADHLGGVGGQVSQAQLCRSFGGTAVHENVVYVPCADGLRAVQITTQGTITPLWRANPSITGSPVLAANRVYALDPSAGTLAVLDAATGHQLQQVEIGRMNRFATPAISGGQLYVGTLDGLTILGAGR